MHLIGYIRPFQPISFSIPVYGDGLDTLYYHQLDANFRISTFCYTKNILQSDLLVRVTPFKVAVNDIGVIIYINDRSNAIIGHADKIIPEILKDIASYPDRSTAIKEEIDEIVPLLEPSKSKDLQLEKPHATQKEPPEVYIFSYADQSIPRYLTEAQFVLEESGYMVRVMSDLTEARMRTMILPPDLIILDISLPRNVMIEAIGVLHRAIRMSGTKKRIQFSLMSGKKGDVPYALFNLGSSGGSHTTSVADELLFLLDKTVNAKGKDTPFE